MYSPEKLAERLTLQELRVAIVNQMLQVVKTMLVTPPADQAPLDHRYRVLQEAYTLRSEEMKDLG